MVSTIPQNMSVIIDKRYHDRLSTTEPSALIYVIQVSIEWASSSLKMIHFCRKPSPFVTLDFSFQISSVPCRLADAGCRRNVRETVRSRTSYCLWWLRVCVVLSSVTIDRIMKIWPVNIGISVDSDSPDTGRVGTALKLLARSVAYSFSLSVQLLII